MKRPFQKPDKGKNEEKTKITNDTSLTDHDYNLNKLFRKGINFMAEEKLDEATEVFEQALRIDPTNVDILLKLGYSRFHLDDYSAALKIYDRILDIDVQVQRLGILER